MGTFDPAQVLADGYSPDAFVDGPLITALRDGALLYVEEINRVPEETLNVLITVMSEGELHVPRLGRVGAAEGFRLVAAMNPFDSVGTARISAAIYDRMCRVTMGYQDAATETRIVLREVPGADPEFAARVVNVVRATRTHPGVRIGSSVRGAIDLVLLADQLAALREHAGRRLRHRARRRAGRAERAPAGLRGRRAPRPTTSCASSGPPSSGRRPTARGPTREKADAPGQGGVPAAGPAARGRRGPRAARRGAAGLDAAARARERAPHFDEVSPEVGVLDEDAFDSALAEDADGALELLGALVGATDEKLAEAARRLAARVVLDLTRAGAAAGRPGSGGWSCGRPTGPTATSTSTPASSRCSWPGPAGRSPPLDELRVSAWGRPSTAVCLVDRPQRLDERRPAGHRRAGHRGVRLAGRRATTRWWRSRTTWWW